MIRYYKVIFKGQFLIDASGTQWTVVLLVLSYSSSKVCLYSIINESNQKVWKTYINKDATGVWRRSVNMQIMQHEERRKKIRLYASICMAEHVYLYIHMCVWHCWNLCPPQHLHKKQNIMIAYE